MLNVVSSPNKAFILAAGFGTRLLPLTRVVPKPLLPLRGTPMIERALAMVKLWGVRDVVVNVHHGANAIVDYLIHREPDELKIQISFEPIILGTGGALTKASWFFGDKDPFWMLNADVAADVDFRPIAKAFVSGKTIASAWVMASRGPRTVECEKGFITDFQSKRPRSEGTYTFCGVHLVDPAVTKYLPREGFASIIDAYQKAMADGWKVAAVPVENALWADIGTPDQYVNAERELISIESEKVGNAVPAVRNNTSVSIRNGFIYGPGVPRKKYSGVMALRAEDALDAEEKKLVHGWKKNIDAVITCPLSPRGSARTFARLYAGSSTAMLVRHKPDREENNLYVGHTRFLAGLGLPVPRVLNEDARNHLALFEDVGTACVQDVASGWTVNQLEKCYRKVLDQLVVFHEEGERTACRNKLKLMPPFDEKLYAWEHELFAKLFLKERSGISDEHISEIKNELSSISKILLKNKSVLVHRDLQSSNILLKNNRWYLIDYQGMRFGPAVYDLASLLCDPYITISPEVRTRLLAYYAGRADPLSRCTQTFWVAVIQRLGQALGAYARLSNLPGMSHFAGYIRPALQNMNEALAHTSGYPALRGVVDSVLAKP
jgi:aminoglycoside/choline kinase family phosphotransferase/dTDP-glucose pyrophosphorylase